MSHSLETKHTFVALRSRGIPLSKISEQLDIPKSTLGRRQNDCEPELQRLQRIEWEEIEAEHANSIHDDLKRIMKRIRAAEDELDKRKLQYFTMQELFQLIRDNRREYARKRALLMGTSKRDKTVRSNENGTTTAETAAYGVPASAGATSEPPQQLTERDKTVRCEENGTGDLPLPRAEGRGEGQTGSAGTERTKRDEMVRVEGNGTTPSAPPVPAVRKSTGDPDLDQFYAGESIPFNAYESTSEFLARSGAVPTT